MNVIDDAVHNKERLIEYLSTLQQTLKGNIHKTYDFQSSETDHNPDVEKRMQSFEKENARFKDDSYKIENELNRINQHLK